MNRLKTNQSGGFPFVLDDLRFLDNAYRQAFTNIAYAISLSDCILWGCDLSDDGTDITVTEGAVWLNGEILHVPEQTITYVPGHNYFLRLSASYDPNGLKTFADSNLYDTYELRVAELFDGGTDTVIASAINIHNDKRINIVNQRDAATNAEMRSSSVSSKFATPASIGRSASLFSGSDAFTDNTPQGVSQSNIADSSSYTKIIRNGNTQHINAYLKSSFGSLGFPFTIFFFRIETFGTISHKFRGFARYEGSSDLFDVIIENKGGYPNALEITMPDGSAFQTGNNIEIWFNETFLMI